MASNLVAFAEGATVTWKSIRSKAAATMNGSLRRQKIMPQLI